MFRFLEPRRAAVTVNPQILPAVLGFALLLGGPTGARAAGGAAESAPLRFGFASEVFYEVNESDARAALKAWVQTIGSDRGIPADTKLQIFADTEAIRAALRDGQVDAVTMLTEQYWALRATLPMGPHILGLTHGQYTEEYVLLVRTIDPARSLADLRGRNVNVINGPRGSLAALWLETLLLEEKLGRPADFWGRITMSPKPARLVLPVFFKQADACVVTRAGFNTMSELNPQVGRQLRVLAKSPPVVPTIFCFRGDLVSPYRDKLVANIGDITKSVAGRQSLALFQADQLLVRPFTDLDETGVLLDRHQQLLAALPATVPPAEEGGRR